ncbi:hypothetical protein GGF37_007368, partial [Kickxella alabastrina]
FIQGKSGGSSNNGIEYVKACDSSQDDVTNMCINRIPEDIGKSSGNRACAYHEAEIKCLGLCGNTVTWKVAYRNSLKRYRLVCASYIDERLAEKEDEADMDGSDGKAANVKKQEQREEVVHKKAVATQGKPLPPKSSPKGKEAASSTVVAKEAKPKASNTVSARRVETDEESVEPKNKGSRSSVAKGEKRNSFKSKEEKELKGQAMLPTMDPE